MKSLNPLRHVNSAMILVISLLAFPPGSHSQSLTPGYPADVKAYDSREVATLPRYCIYTQDFRDKIPGGNDRAQISHWYGVMGDTFHAVHHYCWGLMKTNRALVLARTKQARDFYFNDAIGEFDYVLNGAKPGFLLLPEILTRKGQNLIALGKGHLAIVEFERAMEVKPDYWPPYAYLSDYYKDSGNYGKAKELIEAGLGHTPDAKALQTRLAELEKLDRKAPKSSKK